MYFVLLKRTLGFKDTKKKIRFKTTILCQSVHNYVFTLLNLIWRVPLCPLKTFGLINWWWHTCISLSKSWVTPIALIDWCSMLISSLDTGFWNVLFCQTVWWLSELICQKHEAITNYMPTPILPSPPTSTPCSSAWKKKNPPLSLTRRTGPYLES